MSAVRSQWILLVAVVLVAGAREGVAQGAPPVLPHARVTVDSSVATGNVRFTGALSSWSMDSVTLLLKDGSTLSLPREHITRLEVSHRTRSQAGKGIVKGLFIGAAAGAALGLVTYASTDQDAFFSYGPEVVPTMALGGAIWGVAIGAVAGALSSEPDWQDVDHRVGPAPSGIGLTVRF